MIVGVGTDMIEIARVRKACEKQAFLSRIYTREECRRFGENTVRLAGNFAVKEAVAKALGTGFRNFWPSDVEVLRDDMGKPFVRLLNGALEQAKELGAEVIHVSITNTKEYAAAFAVAETDGTREANAVKEEGRRDIQTGQERGISEAGPVQTRRSKDEISGDRGADEAD